MYHVEEEKQLIALKSPARQEIVDVLSAGGAGTVSEMSAVLGRPADALYYHVRRLLAVGLLVEVGRRRSGKRFEAIYDLPDRDMRIKYDVGNRRIMAPLVKAVSAMLRLCERDFRAGVDLPHAIGDGADRNIWAGRTKAWLTKKEVRQVRQHLEAIGKIMRSTRRTRRNRLHTVSWVMTPLNPSPRLGSKEEE